MAEKHFKKFKVLSHQGSANQNNSEIPSYTHQNGKDQVTAHAGKMGTLLHCW
jgi:hypothetical protein